MASSVPDRGNDPRRKIPPMTQFSVSRSTGEPGWRISSSHPQDTGMLYIGYSKRDAIRRHRDNLRNKVQGDN
jgi:hypothetical protein